MAQGIGCIGCGAMGGAIMAGLCRSLEPGKYVLCGCNRSRGKMETLATLGLRVMPDARAVAANSEIVIIGVKPAQLGGLLEQIAPAISRDQLIISLAAGVPLARLGLARNQPAVRCMPNTPARVGRGVFAFCHNEAATKWKNTVFEIFGHLGLCLEICEDRFTAFSALVGAGPAYVFAIMQAFVQAGVTLGFGHAEAREMIAGLFGGCAAMAKAMPDHHLMVLRDEVCSPAGLTIAGINYMDAIGISGKLVEAVMAANARGTDMESWQSKAFLHPATD